MGAFQPDAFQGDAFEAAGSNFGIDAIIKREQLGSFGIDAEIVTPQIRTTQTAIEVLAQPSNTPIRATQVAVEILSITRVPVRSFGLSAVLLQTDIVGSVGLHAEIVEEGHVPLGKHDRTDAHFGTQQDIWITVGDETLAQYLANLYADVAALQAIPTNVQRFGISAFIEPYFGLDAWITLASTGSFGIDAYLATTRFEQPIGIDALIKAVQGAFRFGIDAVIV